MPVFEPCEGFREDRPNRLPRSASRRASASATIRASSVERASSLASLGRGGCSAARALGPPRLSSSLRRAILSLSATPRTARRRSPPFGRSRSEEAFEPRTPARATSRRAAADSTGCQHIRVSRSGRFLARRFASADLRSAIHPRTPHAARTAAATPADKAPPGAVRRPRAGLPEGAPQDPRAAGRASVRCPADDSLEVALESAGGGVALVGNRGSAGGRPSLGGAAGRAFANAGGVPRRAPARPSLPEPFGPRRERRQRGVSYTTRPARRRRTGRSSALQGFERHYAASRGPLLRRERLRVWAAADAKSMSGLPRPSRSTFAAYVAVQDSALVRMGQGEAAASSLERQTSHAGDPRSASTPTLPTSPAKGAAARRDRQGPPIRPRAEHEV